MAPQGNWRERGRRRDGRMAASLPAATGHPARHAPVPPPGAPGLEAVRPHLDWEPAAVEQPPHCASRQTCQYPNRVSFLTDTIAFGVTSAVIFPS